MFEKRSVLELGGGLTGVCALGLSASVGLYMNRFALIRLGQVCWIMLSLI